MQAQAQSQFSLRIRIINVTSSCSFIRVTWSFFVVLFDEITFVFVGICGVGGISIDFGGIIAEFVGILAQEVLSNSKRF
jgi:hypothetical protein